MKTTTRKTKVVGRESYTNNTTGEIVDMNVVEVEERDSNFKKVWLGHILETMEIIGNKKIKVVFHILDNLNSENLFLGTQREIETELNISQKTINETLQALQEGKFLKMVRSGLYQVSPEVIFKGSHNHRMNVLIKYRDTKAKNETPPPNIEEQRQQRAEKIAELERELEKLKTQERLESEEQQPKLRLAK